MAYSEVSNAICDIGMRNGAKWAHCFSNIGTILGRLNNATSPTSTQRSEMQSINRSVWIIDRLGFFFGLLQVTPTIARDDVEFRKRLKQKIFAVYNRTFEMWLQLKLSYLLLLITSSFHIPIIEALTSWYGFSRIFHRKSFNFLCNRIRFFISTSCPKIKHLLKKKP